MHPAVHTYLALLDTALPDAYTGVYLTGSTALGDWQPDRSDLDILTLTTRPLTEADLDALAAAHATVTERPYLDAIYVPAADVGRELMGDGVPYTVDGVFARAGHLPDPVLWATLDRHGVTVVGPAAATLGAAPDPAWLREWNIGNLNGYWRGWSADARAGLAERDPDSPLTTSTVAGHALLGPGRLHHTIATGEILAKTAAADYTAKHFPAYTEILGRAKAWRLGDDTITFTATDGVTTCDLIEAVIADVA
ncbi:MAG TPA: nucleotidyltransferase domain-containing protein [Pseudonocardiaceae bacterium]